jgi:DNA-binding transcriptional ArsR family regulator
MAYRQAIAALADPTRLMIFEKLRKGPAPVGVLAKGLHVTRPAVSQHLKVLEGAGLVRARREGARRIYQVEVEGLYELRRYLDQFWGEALAAFKAEADQR